MLQFITIAGQRLPLYNMAIAAGAVLALLAFYRRERTLSPREKDDAVAAVGISIVAGFVCAAVGDRIAHAQSWADLAQIPLRYTGISFIWGAAGGVACFLAAFRAFAGRGARLACAASALCPYLAFAQMWGRLGCFLGGCCFGRPTDLPIGVSYPEGSLPHSMYGDAKLWPTQLLEIALLGAMIAAMRLWPPAIRSRASFCVISYSIGRFAIEFFRGDDRGAFHAGLSPTQLFCAVLLTAALARIAIRKLRGR